MRPSLTGSFSVVFIDESKTAAQDVSSPESGPDESTAVWSSASGPPDDPSPQTPLLSSDTAPFRPRSPTDRFLIPSVPGPSISSLSPRVWPLANHAEAFLFRHFVEHLASWVTYPTTPLSPPALVSRHLWTVANPMLVSLSLTCATRIVRVDLHSISPTLLPGPRSGLRLAHPVPS